MRLSVAEEAVARVLVEDPRISIADLAKTLDVSTTTAGRRLDAVLRAQPVLRCEVAQSLSGWPVHATFFFRCPADKVNLTGRSLAKLREVARCHDNDWSSQPLCCSLASVP